MQYLCQDCTKLYKYPSNGFKDPSRCNHCGSPRIIAHAELDRLTIAHIDCDAFFAAIEKRDNPDLAGRPVIIGGGVRSVVATCCYIARQSGIHSAMPALRAKKLCPDAVFIRPNMEKYVAASKQIMALMQELTPLVEPVSVDEAFLDLSGTKSLHKACAAEVLAKIAIKIEKQVGISVSIGLSYNKFLAKMASDINKPRGFSIIGKEEVLSFLEPLAISKIFGVGKVFAQKLKKDGFQTIGDLQKHPSNNLILRYGDMGASLSKLSHGIDDRKVEITRKRKSVGSERTFPKDIADFEILSTKLFELCENVSFSLKQKNLTGDTITLKLKSSNFESRTRSKQIILPTQLAHIIFEIAQNILAKEIDGTNFRLIGIAISGLQKGMGIDPVDLIDPKIARKVAAERAVDNLRDKFGKQAVVLGRLYHHDNKSDRVSERDKEREK
ncbi:MAG: DNA polymerase IV [Devosiaceae bacterium]|nr:DNA polymerase IV [Devosiaceae bacterium]